MPMIISHEGAPWSRPRNGAESMATRNRSMKGGPARYRSDPGGGMPPSECGELL